MLRMKTVKQLNGRRREEVRELERICCVHDGLQGGVLFSAEEEKPLFFLCYDEELLVGTAIMYSAGMTTETYCFIHPEYRGRATSKKIYVAIRKELDLRGLSENYMVFEPHVSPLLDQITKEKIVVYSHSEYMMEWKYSYQMQNTGMLRISALAESEQQMAAGVLAGAFGASPEEMLARVQHAAEQNCLYYGAWEKNVLIGIFAVMPGKERVYVLDFAVNADYQRRGCGRELLKGLIYTVQQSEGMQKSIYIQVGSLNEAAFRLYQKNGFQVISQRDYYLIAMPE